MNRQFSIWLHFSRSDHNRNENKKPKNKKKNENKPKPNQKKNSEIVQLLSMEQPPIKNNQIKIN